MNGSEQQDRAWALSLLFSEGAVAVSYTHLDSAGRYRSLPPEVSRVVTAKNVRIQSEDDIVTCLDGEDVYKRQAHGSPLSMARFNSTFT